MYGRFGPAFIYAVRKKTLIRLFDLGYLEHDFRH
jgi:hypothetical protein